MTVEHIISFSIDPDDFSGVSSEITFSSPLNIGLNQVQIPISTINDLVAEAEEFFTATLTNVVGATLQPPGVAFVLIQDND